MLNVAIVDVVDEFWQIIGDIAEGLVVHPVDGLDLQRLHEALCFGVVAGIALPAMEPRNPCSATRLRYISSAY